MAQRVHEYAQGLKELTTLLERAHTRVMLALCSREDMEAILAQVDMDANLPDGRSIQ